MIKKIICLAIVLFAAHFADARCTNTEGSYLLKARFYNCKEPIEKFYQQNEGASEVRKAATDVCMSGCYLKKDNPTCISKYSDALNTFDFDSAAKKMGCSIRAPTYAAAFEAVDKSRNPDDQCYWDSMAGISLNCSGQKPTSGFKPSPICGGSTILCSGVLTCRRDVDTNDGPLSRNEAHRVACLAPKGEKFCEQVSPKYCINDQNAVVQPQLKDVANAIVEQLSKPTQ